MLEVDRGLAACLCASMAISLLAAGCDDAGEEDLERLLPGPCSATRHAEGSDDIELECGMEYDDVDRLATMTCSLFEGAQWWQLTRAFTGDELTEVTWTYERRPEPGMADRDEAETWTLGETVTRTTVVADDEPGDFEVVATYEGEGFQFLGHPFDPEQRPEAPDALLSSVATSTDDPSPVDTAVDYTYDGPPREGTRTRTGSDGTIVEFGYDTAGRLIEQREMPDAGVMVERTLAYQGDLPSEIDWRVTIDGGSDDSRSTYEHDVHGNLIAKRFFPVDPPIQITDFDYACW